MTDAPGLLIRVLGPVEVVSESGLAQLGGPKQRAVLAMLTARSGRVVTTDELVDGIWGDEPPTAVSSSIHSYISNLRTVIDQPIERHGSGYVLDVDRSRIDANVFEDAFERGRKELVTNPTVSADELRRALALWRGRAYADVADFPGLTDEARRLTDLRLTAVEVRIEADLALGRHVAVVGELEALAAENPYRESLRAKHMLALYRDGRQADALRAFQRTREHLREELGVDPSPELADLEERILNHDYTLIHSREVVSDQVSLLFTDIVDSTLLWETNSAAMQAALTRHDHVVQSAVEAAGGTVIKGMGDGFIAAFSEPSLAARAALTAQQAITGTDWSPLDFKVRMAIDTGEVERRGGDLFGPAMNRGARLLNASHGGQIVLSDDAQKAITRDAGTQVKSLGEHRFKGLGTPQSVHQLVADDLPSNFPPLNVAGGSLELDRSFGDSIRGYELRERIGRGAFATVYRGYQPTIGREVAIKIVKPEFANHPAFIRRFESEARLVASFEHPHIASVYDYWRDADGAYIVGPYLAGRSLADATFATMSMTQVIRIASQVGSALSYAHRQGVVHRDVKPANILLDSDGNAYLADFGIAARAVEAITGIQSKSVGYRAPEDHDGGAVDTRADQYGLAAVVARLLTGVPPERLDLSSLDVRIQDVLARGLAEEPAARYDTVDEFLDHLATRAGGTEAPRTPTSHRNPYKGLAAFSQLDGPDFFGRSDEIKRLVSMVGENRLSAVVGPSGSGKSSLTLAGLLPALAAGAAPGSETWISVRAVPGGYPFDELATALGALSTEPLSALVTELAAPDNRGLLRVAKRIGQELDGELLIVIDQFEELFTLVPDDDIRNAFATSLVTAAADPVSKVRIVLTLRADFFHQVLTQPLLGPIIGRIHLALAPLDTDGIRLAIVEPAARAGLQFEPGLPERMVADLKDQPGSLPLLQFTLDRLAMAATDGFIADHHYTDLGGVKGALADRAETIFQTLTDNQKQAAQQIFTRLLSVSDEANDVRRRVRMTELESIGLAQADLEAVVGGFGKERLLTFDVDPTTRGATVEVAHEALLREWPTLRSWVDSRRESLVLQRRFQVAMGEWEEADRNPSNLLTGGKVSQYQEWAGAENTALTTAERGFLDASVHRANSEAAARRTRRRRIMGGFAGAAVLALVLAGFALVQRGQAEDSARRATAGELATWSMLALEEDPERAILLALEAVDLSLAAGERPLPNAINALQRATQSSRLVRRFEGGDPYLAVSPFGGWMVLSGAWDTEAGVASRIAIVYDFEGEEQSRLVGESPLADLAVSPGAGLVAAAYDTTDLIDHDAVVLAVVLFDPLNGEESIRLEGPPQDYEGLDFSPDGRRVLGGSDPVLVWDLETGEEIASLPAYVVGARFLSGGEELLVMLEGEKPGWGIFSLPGWELNYRFEVDAPLSNMALNPDRTRVALGSSTGSSTEEEVLVYDVITGELILDPIDGQSGAWSPDGRLLAVSSVNLAVITVFDVETESVFLELKGSATGVEGLAFTPDGKHLLSSQYTAHEQTLMWDISSRGRPELEVISTHTGPPGGVQISPDQTQIAGFIGDPPGFELLDARTGGLLALLPNQLYQASYRLRAVSPDFSLVASLEADSRSTIRRLPSLEVVLELRDCTTTLAFSPDNSLAMVREVACDALNGELTVMADELEVQVTGRLGYSFDVVEPSPPRLQRHGMAPDEPPASTVVDIKTGAVVFELPARSIAFAAFNPPGALEGGRYLALTLNGLESVEIWDIKAEERVGEIHTSDLGVVLFFKFSFDASGRFLAVPTSDGRVVVVDTLAVVGGATMKDSIVFDRVVHTGQTFNPSITRDGRLITGGIDKLVRVWDLHTGELLVEFRTDSDNPWPVLSPDESFLLYSGTGNLIQRFYLDPERLVTLAESLLTRGFTDDECRRYPVTCPTASSDS